MATATVNNGSDRLKDHPESSSQTSNRPKSFDEILRELRVPEIHIKDYMKAYNEAINRGFKYGTRNSPSVSMAAVSVVCSRDKGISMPIKQLSEVLSKNDILIAQASNKRPIDITRAYIFGCVRQYEKEFGVRPANGRDMFKEACGNVKNIQPLVDATQKDVTDALKILRQLKEKDMQFVMGTDSVSAVALHRAMAANGRRMPMHVFVRKTGILGMQQKAVFVEELLRNGQDNNN